MERITMTLNFGSVKLPMQSMGDLMLHKVSLLLLAVATLSLAPPPASAGAVRFGVLSCDISAGIGLIFTEKQTMNCTYTPDNGGESEQYVGSIEEVGLELGTTSGGHLTWVVAAASLENRPSRGALAGTYVGAAADASLGEGVGANDLSGGFNGSFVLQPYSFETQRGLNFAAGIAKVTIRAAD
jgi:hypothetical protein